MSKHIKILQLLTKIQGSCNRILDLRQQSVGHTIFSQAKIRSKFVTSAARDLPHAAGNQRQALKWSLQGQGFRGLIS